MVATRQWCYLTHSWGRYWWASGRVHTPVGPAHCTSGATYCSEISSTLAWGRKVPSVRGVPREGSTRVLSVERLCTSREDLRTLLPFRPRAIWRLRLKARARSRSYTLLYSTCSTSRITQACVFTPHHPPCHIYNINRRLPQWNRQVTDDNHSEIDKWQTTSTVK